jgi:hypothetical protein
MLGAFAAVAVITGMILPASPALAAEADFEVSPNIINVNSGDTFDVDVILTTTAEANAAGFQMNWNTPNSGIIRCTGMQMETGAGSWWEGTYPSLLGMGTYDADNGTTEQFAGYLTSGTIPPRSASFATVSFEALSDGQVDLDLFDLQVANGPTALSTVDLDGDVFVGGMPDLVVTSKSENWGTEGQDYTVTYTVKNEGSQPAAASYTEIKVDGAQVLVEACPALNADESYSNTTSLISFDTDSSGADTIMVCADTDSVAPAQNDLVLESDETNNCMTNVWAFNQIWIVPDQTTVQVGDPEFDVDVMVALTNPAHAAGFQMEWPDVVGELTCTGISEGDFFSLAGTTQTFGGGFDPTTGTTEQYAVTLNGDLTQTGSGVLATLTFQASEAGTVDLSLFDIQIKDLNNDDIQFATGPDETITIEAADYIDIAPTFKEEVFDVDGNGDPVYYVNWTVERYGSKAAKEGAQIAIVENDTVLEIIDWVCEASDPVLNGTSGPWPVPATSDDTIIKVIADYRDDAHESDETNNVLENTLPYLPNLVVVAKYEEEIAPGEYQVFTTVKNLGPATSGACQLGVWVDDVRHNDDTWGIPALASGESFTKQYPGGDNGIAISGTSDKVEVMVDVAGVVIEWCETDNTRVQIYSLIAADCFTPVTGQPLPVIEITCPGEIEMWYWEVGVNERTGIMNVKSNTDWQVEAQDADPITFGHMTEWDGSSYYGTQLINPMEVGSDNGSVFLENRGIIKTGSVSGQAGNDGEDFEVTFNQEVELQDPAYLDNGNIYHMVINFIAGASF